MTAGTSIVFASYGVTAEVVVEDEALVDEVSYRLPPGWQPAAADAVVQGRFTLTAGGDLIVDGETVADADDRSPVDRLESAVRGLVAMEAREYVFVHAGVAAVQERAIVLPGASFAGKSTLVTALVAAGADYYSDEMAVLDIDGRVHPYPRPLSLRLPGKPRQQQYDVAALGGVAANVAADVAIVAALRYFPGGPWRPATMSAAEGALALLSQTIPVRDRPAQAIKVARRAIENAILIEGGRGEANEAADALLALLAGDDAPA